MLLINAIFLRFPTYLHRFYGLIIHPLDSSQTPMFVVAVIAIDIHMLTYINPRINPRNCGMRFSYTFLCTALALFLTVAIRTTHAQDCKSCVDVKVSTELNPDGHVVASAEMDIEKTC